MTNKPIDELQAKEALQQAIKASHLLLNQLATFSDAEATKQEDQQEKQQLKTDKLTLLRDQLVKQVFSYTWTENEVMDYQEDFELLETLNAQLIKKASEVRYDLHQQRVDNQQGRKAVSAYGTAKGQFHR